MKKTLETMAINEELNGAAQAQVVTSIAPAQGEKLTLAKVREKLAGQTGRRFWKNLDELAATEEFDTLMQEGVPAPGDAGRVGPMRSRGAVS